jgi:hypothetical protein
VLLCQFLVLAGNRFWLYILLCTWSPIQLFSVVAESFITTGKKVLVVCLAGCAVVSVFGIGFGCTYYYVLGVPYSCGFVLVFSVLAGNSFWCYVRT